MRTKLTNAHVDNRISINRQCFNVALGHGVTLQRRYNDPIEKNEKYLTLMVPRTSSSFYHIFAS